MKEDILEQIIDDWFLSKPGTFTKHNLKFKPDISDDGYISRQDSVNSDIDVLAVHLAEDGVKKVSSASCKSWQDGFNPGKTLTALLNEREAIPGRRETWRYFRELANKKWGKAFSRKIFQETRSKDFTYYLCVTKLVGNKGVDIKKSKQEFENCEFFIKNLMYDDSSNVKIEIITFQKIINEYFDREKSTTPEATNIGRLIQIFRAANINLEKYAD